MAAKKSTRRADKAGAKKASTAATLRDHVREISVGAFRDGKFSLRDVSSLVHEVLDGAVQTVDKSIPRSDKNILREVFNGLSEGVHQAASAASAVASEAGKHARTTAGKDAPAAARRIREANEEFLDAVKSFAGKTTRHVREELDTLVARAEKAGPKMTAAAREAYQAADGRWGELAGETARAGARVAGSTAGAIASTASGFFDGIAQAVTPKGRPATAKKPRAKAARAAKKKANGRASKKKPAAGRRAR